MLNNELEECTPRGAYSAVLLGVRKHNCRCGVCAAYKSLLAVYNKVTSDLDDMALGLQRLAIKPCIQDCEPCTKQRLKHFTQ